MWVNIFLKVWFSQGKQINCSCGLENKRDGFIFFKGTGTEHYDPLSKKVKWAYFFHWSILIYWPRKRQIRLNLSTWIYRKRADELNYDDTFSASNIRNDFFSSIINELQYFLRLEEENNLWEQSGFESIKNSLRVKSNI